MSAKKSALCRKRAEWVEIADPIQEADIDRGLTAAGFDRSLEVTGAGPLELEFWLRQGKRPEAYISISDYSQCPGVYAETLPDAMEVLALWMPVVTHSAVLDFMRKFDAYQPYHDVIKYKPDNAWEALMKLIRKAEVSA